MNQLPWREPQQLAAALQQRYGHQGLVWLDGDGSQRGRYAVLAAGPSEQVRCDGLPGDPGASDPFAALQQAFARGAGHWLGWLSYEAAAWIEPGDHWHRPAMAQLWAGHYAVVIELDLQERQLQLSGDGPQRSELEQLILQSPPVLEDCDAAIPLTEWQWLTSSADYGRQVQQVRDWISAG
ncbi:MAG: anthranilate synthase component I family protein, partial [Synechococcus sp.]